MLSSEPPDVLSNKAIDFLVVITNSLIPRVTIASSRNIVNRNLDITLSSFLFRCERCFRYDAFIRTTALSVEGKESEGIRGTINV